MYNEERYRIVQLCVEWESINAGWHINVHYDYVKMFRTYMKCEVEQNGIWGRGIHDLNGWGIND